MIQKAVSGSFKNGTVTFGYYYDDVTLEITGYWADNPGDTRLLFRLPGKIAKSKVEQEVKATEADIETKDAGAVTSQVVGGVPHPMGVEVAFSWQ